MGVLALLLLTLLGVGRSTRPSSRRATCGTCWCRRPPTVIVACGLTFVIVLGEIDISVGAQLGLLAAVLGQTTSPTHAHLPVVVGCRP